MRLDFSDQVVLVTGAASGIGRAAAVGFAARGALVYAADLSEPGLEETSELAADAGGEARIARADVADETDVLVLLERIDHESGRLDVAFNNAGIPGGAYRLEDYPTEDFEHVLAINLRGVFLGMKYELRLMRRNNRGAIVNTASVAALTGPGGMSAYAASKHGVHGLTRVAAIENASHGIRVNAIAPGWTETPMVAANIAQNPAFAEVMRRDIPAKRGALPEEIAAAAIWLSSDDASYMYGHLLVVDGGMTVGGFEP